jgi:hypothetical protein
LQFGFGVLDFLKEKQLSVAVGNSWEAFVIATYPSYLLTVEMVFPAVNLLGNLLAHLRLLFSEKVLTLHTASSRWIETISLRF